MRTNGISGLIEKRRGNTTVRAPGVKVASDKVLRDFTAEKPNQLWVADITYLRTWEGWIYLAAVQDAYSRRIVGWSMAEHMRTELVTDALLMAVKRRRPDPGLIHHSDHGSQLGFKESSQHPDCGGVNGTTTRLVESTDRQGTYAVARATAAEPRGKAPLLEVDRRRTLKRRSRD